MAKTASKTAPASAPKSKPRRRAPKFLRAIGGYFAGAWRELRQVRWPNRRATWSLTFAVVVFSIFFAAVILGLDYLFHYLFKEILL